MSHLQPTIVCSNPDCPEPTNPLGQVLCRACQTPLTYRYLWAVGSESEEIPAGEWVADRYYVLTPQIWLDTYPHLSPLIPDWLPDAILPYLYLYPQLLHVPVVYGFAPIAEAPTSPEEPGSDAAPPLILLLDNAPIDAKGNLLPSLVHLWPRMPAVRQVYWLWQILQLWPPLSEQNVAASLLVIDNLRVEGWRVRLQELYASNCSLRELGDYWFPWALSAQPTVSERLQEICKQMQAEEANWEAIAAQLNQLLLEQAAQLPLQIKWAGASDVGPQRSHNEDSIYPTPQDLREEANGELGRVVNWAIVCDGIGGHEGGEVASQLAVQSLKLQVKALLAEIAEQTELMSPEVVSEQLTAIVRVVNNMIAAQNDSQGRESRQRMGTTLVMALQVPQKVTLPAGARLNAHELYLVQVGDSRAYWITPHYCHLLTVDDDVSTREVRMGRSLYLEALKRPDAGALTQALGTKTSDFLHPRVQRFVLEEDGLLLLCSDGLSDNNWVEKSWGSYVEPVLRGQMSLETAVKSLIDLANERNGYDNSSVVLACCRVSTEHYLELFDPTKRVTALEPAETEFTEASQALFDDTETAAPEPVPAAAATQRRPTWAIALGILLLLFAVGGTGLFAWSQLDPVGFDRVRQQLPESLR